MIRGPSSGLRLVLTGATGFAGGEVLRQALLDSGIERVLLLTRKPVGIDHPKLEERIIKDFEDYSGVDLASRDACIWCLGVSQNSVNEEQYIKITHDYTLAAARAMFAANPSMRFCFLSGQGADPEEKGGALYKRIKGRTEKHLNELLASLTASPPAESPTPAPTVAIFRPAYIKPSAASGPRKDMARFLAPLGTVMGWFSDKLVVDCDQLAKCMLGVAKEGPAQPLYDNMAIRDWKAAAE